MVLHFLSLQSMSVSFRLLQIIVLNLDPISDVDENLHVVPPLITAPPRRFVRERWSAIPIDYVMYSVEGDLSDFTNLISYHQAMNSRFVVQWREAIEDELKSMTQNCVRAKTLA